jgi:hypothetical protein
MKIHKRLLLALAAFGLGTTSLTAPGLAQAPSQVATLDNGEEACEAALRENTIEAIEEFLRKYPDSACRVLAMNALQSFEPDGPGDPGPPSPPGYGS